jgi:hypothetical protein
MVSFREQKSRLSRAEKANTASEVNEFLARLSLSHIL